MPQEDITFQPRLGTVLATFAQNGTYSSAVQLNGRLVGLVSDDFPSAAAGSITFRASMSSTGTGHAVQTNDGTALRVLAWSSAMYVQFGEDRFTTAALGVPAFVRLQLGTAGTATAASGGTIVLITQAGN